MTKANNSLDTASDEIKLAVDLIYLLESNEIEVQTALKALDIVKKDLQAKLASMKDNENKEN